MKRLILGHHLPSPVEVAVYAADAADQKPDDDLKKMPFYLWEILPQRGAQFC